MQTLPTDVLEIIATKLVAGCRDANPWRKPFDVVHDHAAVSMTAKAFASLAGLLRAVAAPMIPQNDRPASILTFDETVRLRGTLDGLKVAELKELLRSWGLLLAGPKRAMVERLRSFLTLCPDHAKSLVAVGARHRYARVRMCASRAKSEFRLNDKALGALKYELVSNTHYRNAPPMRLYRIADLRAAAIAKYGSIARVEARRVPRGERRSNARAKRQAQLDTLVLEYDIETEADEVAWEDATRKFLGNGSGGVERVKRVFPLLRQFYRLGSEDQRLLRMGEARASFWVPPADMEAVLETRRARFQHVQAVDGAGDGNLLHVPDSDDENEEEVDRLTAVENYVVNGAGLEKLQERVGRKAGLQEMLGARGLVLRQDSALCRDYILYGGDAEHVVDVMEEMAWLFRHGHLQYASKVEGRVDTAIEISRMVNGRLGRLEFREMVRDERARASERVKVEIARSLVKDGVVGELLPLPVLMVKRMARTG